jgi:hypothetical protein
MTKVGDELPRPISNFPKNHVGMIVMLWARDVTLGQAA